MSAKGLQAVSQIRKTSSCEAQAAGWFYTQPVLKTREDVSEIITALVAEYSTTLYRVAYSVTRNAAEAEDCGPLLSADRHRRNKLSLCSEGIDGMPIRYVIPILPPPCSPISQRYSSPPNPSVSCRKCSSEYARRHDRTPSINKVKGTTGSK